MEVYRPGPDVGVLENPKPQAGGEERSMTTYSDNTSGNLTFLVPRGANIGTGPDGIEKGVLPGCLWNLAEI